MGFYLYFLSRTVFQLQKKRLHKVENATRELQVEHAVKSSPNKKKKLPKGKANKWANW